MRVLTFLACWRRGGALGQIPLDIIKIIAEYASHYSVFDIIDDVDITGLSTDEVKYITPSAPENYELVIHLGIKVYKFPKVCIINGIKLSFIKQHCSWEAKFDIDISSAYDSFESYCRRVNDDPGIINWKPTLTFNTDRRHILTTGWEINYSAFSWSNISDFTVKYRRKEAFREKIRCDISSRKLKKAIKEGRTKI